MSDILLGLSVFFWIISGVMLFIEFAITMIIPKIQNIIIKKNMKNFIKNPKWLIDYLRKNHYGFNDIDMYLAKDDTIKYLPYMMLDKNKSLKLFLPSAITTNDIEEIGKLALIGKLQINYNVGFNYADKSLQWLAILCYLLDGNDYGIVENSRWKVKNKTD